MGLFGNLFEKKICSICGNEIKLLGNRKLEDGNMCKECANKLSPWFSDRRQSTVAQIQEQLAYREANKTQVESFNVTRTLGQSTKVLLDENQNKFIVTSSSNWKNSNPDVLDFSAVTGCIIDVDENKTELKQEGKDNTKVSYNPPQYDYSYDIYLTIHVNNPYFDEMRFRVNKNTIEIDNPMVRQMNTTQPQSNQIKQQTNKPQAKQASVGRAQALGHSVNAKAGSNMANAVINGVVNALGNQGTTFVPQPEENYEFKEAMAIANEIKEALTGIREQVRDEIKASAAPKQKVTCPWCGATTIPDSNGCCEYCGGSLNE